MKDPIRSNLYNQIQLHRAMSALIYLASDGVWLHSQPVSQGGGHARKVSIHVTEIMHVPWEGLAAAVAGDWDWKPCEN